jgi:hypothetical protein
MTAPATIAAIGATHCCKFISHEMPAAGAAMSATAENTNLVNKIAFFQNCNLKMRCKYTLLYSGCVNLNLVSLSTLK